MDSPVILVEDKTTIKGGTYPQRDYGTLSSETAIPYRDFNVGLLSVRPEAFERGPHLPRNTLPGRAANMSGKNPDETQKNMLLKRGALGLAVDRFGVQGSKTEDVLKQKSQSKYCIMVLGGAGVGTSTTTTQKRDCKQDTSLVRLPHLKKRMA